MAARATVWTGGFRWDVRQRYIDSKAGETRYEITRRCAGHWTESAACISGLHVQTIGQVEYERAIGREARLRAVGELPAEQ